MIQKNWQELIRPNKLQVSAGGDAARVATVVATTAAGAFLVWLRVETGSIWVPVAVHAGVNMTLAIFARLATRPQLRPALSTEY